MDNLSLLVGRYGTLHDRRYPTMLVAYTRRSDLSADLFRLAARETGASHVDVVQATNKGELHATVGAFMRHHLLAWLKEKSRTDRGLWVENADSVISTWTEREQRAFFMEFLKTESRSSDGSATPIVLASALAGRFNLPEEPRGQGLVVRVQMDTGAGGTP
jgi:hypothetical protein